MRVYVEREKERARGLCKERTHIRVEAGEFEICRAGRSAGAPGRMLRVRDAPQGEFPLLWRLRSFLLRFSTDWMRPANIMEENQVYSTSIDLKIRFKITVTSRLVFYQKTRYRGLAELTCKINQHSSHDLHGTQGLSCTLKALHTAVPAGL